MWWLRNAHLEQRDEDPGLRQSVLHAGLHLAAETRWKIELLNESNNKIK